MAQAVGCACQFVEQEGERKCGWYNKDQAVMLAYGSMFWKLPRGLSKTYQR